MPRVACEICGKEHYVKPCRMNRSHFCSHECYSKSMVVEVEVKCTTCGKTLIRKPSGVKKENFCDLKCRDAYRVGANSPRYKECPKKLCEICGKEIKHHSASRNYSKYCSRKCQADSKRGDKSRFWKDGNYPYSSGFGSVRQKIRKRDGNVCQSCGSNAYGKKALHVHHIDGNKKNSISSNLMTLCPLCHRRAHRKQPVEIKGEFWPQTP